MGLRRLFLSAAIAALLVSAPPAAASGGTLRCGDTVTRDVVLHANLSDCPLVGLRVGAPGVTIDLNGHTVDGDGVPDGAIGTDVGVVTSGFADSTVTNGAIRQFGVGVMVRSAAGARLQAVHVTEPTYYGVF